MTALVRNFRYAARILSSSPGFCAVAALTLAVGLGANTAMFTVVNAMLLRPLPFPNHDRIVHLWATNPARGLVHDLEVEHLAMTEAKQQRQPAT